MKIRGTSIILALLGLCLHTDAIAQIVKDFKPVCDTLTTIMQERTGVYSKLKMKSVMKRGSTLDFYFTETLGDLPWHDGDPQSFKTLLKTHLPQKYSCYNIGEIFSRGISINHLITPELGFDGTPRVSRQRTKTPTNERFIVKRLDGNDFTQGLGNRTIALWQSHGRYYSKDSQRWEWQRPCLFHTVEDMFTQGFVLPYLVPMLENAGAYVIMPRERDFRKEEVIVDNDPSWQTSEQTGEEYGYGINGPSRTTGTYRESKQWEDAGTGFADTKAVYSGTDNPFISGTSRKVSCRNTETNAPRVEWIPEIKATGDYAVYVSYKSFPKSTSCAHYIVHHAGGKSEFAVNQKKGGGMWIYLGTFPFEEGCKGYVELLARTPDGFRHEPGSIVSADAVRFGGGMGNIERNGEVSGMPRNAEAARYYLQWSGADSSVYSQNEDKSDYKDDFMSRGDWSAWISEGSETNPGKLGKGIPVDLTFGFHSDAGTTPNDSIVGTLAIYTFKSEGKTELPSKESRMTSREYADVVQSQIINDIRSEMNPDWSRRQTWDRGYRESRTPASPAMLLELLSHQNFEDMKYGMDPQFRFIVSRAIYKGMLKYLSNRYGIPYIVQPLPVTSAAVRFTGDDEVEISWKTRNDRIEPTAVAEGFILQTRINDGAFDNGVKVNVQADNDGRFRVVRKIRKGDIYSWKITAVNGGGISFPSEIISAGAPAKDINKDASKDTNKDASKDANKDNPQRSILIVNNFDRVSSPAFIDTPSYAGFDNRADRGVSYINEIAYIGDMNEFRREKEWISNENPGFGASYSGYAGNTVAGNTFDFPFIHGKAIIKYGYRFFSCSNDAFVADSTLTDGASCIDLICGKQITTWKGKERSAHTIFTPEIQHALKKFTSKGGNLIVSGSNIGTDIWDRIYPVVKDSIATVQAKEFAKKTLGFRWAGNHAGQNGKVIMTVNGGQKPGLPAVYFHTSPNPDRYCIESPDGIAPASTSAKTFLRYADSGTSAGIIYQGNGYMTACLGFPVETLCTEEEIYETISLILNCLKL